MKYSNAQVHNMKGSIVLPLVQIMLIIIISALLCLIIFLYLFNNSYGPEASLSFSIFISHLPELLLKIFPIVVLISIVLSLINTLKTPANRVFAALFTLITASLIYYGGYTGLYKLNQISTQRPIIEGNHLYYSKINPLKNSYLYLNGTKENFTAVKIRNKTENSSFIIYDNKLKSENGGNILIEPSNPFFSKIFAPPKFFKGLLSDLNVFNTAIGNTFEKSRLLFLLTILSQVAFAIGCWTIIKLSNWPFLNGLLAIAVIRLFPAYYRFSYNELAQKAIGFLKTSYASDIAPAAILFILAILLFLLDILFIKSRSKADSNG